MAADQQQQLAATDMVQNAAPEQTIKTGHSVWQAAYDPQRPAQRKQVEPVAPAKPAADAEKACAPSVSYLQFVDKALAQAYDPQKFSNGQVDVRHEFDCQIHSEADARKYAALVLKRSGDSHTEILSPSENQQWINDKHPKFIGFGLKTAFDPSRSTPGHEQGVAVERAYPGGPGALAGLQPGDVITSIDTQDLTKLPFLEANGKLHGLAGSVAKVSGERDGQPFSVDLERKSVDIPAVTEASFANKLAYISINDFSNERLPDQLETALKKHGDARGFVIDLRHNGGGNVDLENLALSEVMRNGEIVKMRARNADDPAHVSYMTKVYKLTAKGIEATETSELASSSRYAIGDSGESVNFTNLSTPKVTLQPRRKNLVGNRPVVILTDNGTASAAEMFTGAEHDTGHARVLGTRSYGKGIGGLYSGKDMPDKAGEVVTNMRWYTPAGHWAGNAENEKDGLTPDKEVVNSYGAIPLTAADKVVEAAQIDLEETLAKKPHH